MDALLRIIRVALAALSFFAGGVKFVLPDEQLTAGFPLPLLFIKFIGVCEVLGALGLILRSLLRIRPGLTPLGAAGLVIIMIGATAITTTAMGIPTALMPLVLGLLAAFVADGRWRLAPIRGRARGGPAV